MYDLTPLNRITYDVCWLGVIKVVEKQALSKINFTRVLLSDTLIFGVAECQFLECLLLHGDCGCDFVASSEVLREYLADKEMDLVACFLVLQFSKPKNDPFL